MKKFLLKTIIISLILIFCCACNIYESDDNFRGGQLLDNEAIESMKYELLTTSEKETQSTEFYNATEETINTSSDTDSGESVVYWLKSGSTWHADKDCRHIIYKPCIYGTVAQAIADGKESPCQSCFNIDE